MSITDLSIPQLRHVIALKKRKAKIDRELASLVPTNGANGHTLRGRPRKKRPPMPEAVKRRLARIAKERWAKVPVDKRRGGGFAKG